MHRALLVLTILFAVHFTPVSAAEPDCSAWHLEGVRVGMTMAEIQETVGGRARETHVDRYATGIGWPAEPPTVNEPKEGLRWDFTWEPRGHKRISFAATFAADPREDPSARAIRIKAHWQQSPFESFAEAGVPKPAVVTSVLSEKWGEPDCRIEDHFLELNWKSRECSIQAAYHTGSFGSAYTAFHSWIVIAGPGLLIDSCRNATRPASPLGPAELDDLLCSKPRTR